jgi:hypothetical protein
MNKKFNQLVFLLQTDNGRTELEVIPAEASSIHLLTVTSLS